MKSEVINERVSMITVYNRETGKVTPYKMRWQGRTYLIKQVAYHHKARRGRTIFHIFHVTDGTNDYKLNLDTETLQWVLEEIVQGS